MSEELDKRKSPADSFLWGFDFISTYFFRDNILRIHFFSLFLQSGIQVPLSAAVRYDGTQHSSEPVLASCNESVKRMFITVLKRGQIQAMDDMQ